MGKAPDKGVVVLGSTGSIGRSTLAVLALHPEQFQVVALTARRDSETLFQQCLEHRPDFAVLVEDADAGPLEQRLKKAGLLTRLLTGSKALAEVAALPQADIVMAAVVGAVGLLPTLAAARAGKQLLLANKESLVMAGHLFMDAVHESGATLIPIDSEHNAVFQCLPMTVQAQSQDDNGDLSSAGVRRIILTASGGPFRILPMEEMATVTPEAACKHPKWSMGRKISVDSATLMNKGLEVIEAHWLFGLQPEIIDVVVHPQSVVHSLVEYVDGSMLAQLGNPDMRTPIAHALAWPKRMESGVTSLDLANAGQLDFQAPDLDRFPCLQYAYDALSAGGAMPAVLNAANEVAVAQFLKGGLPFTGIARCVAQALETFSDSATQVIDQLDELLALDQEVRNWSRTEGQKSAMV